MSEGVARTLKCLSCGVVVRQDGALPEKCPACGVAWREPGVAILERADVQTDGASILKDGGE